MGCTTSSHPLPPTKPSDSTIKENTRPLNNEQNIQPFNMQTSAPPTLVVAPQELEPAKLAEDREQEDIENLMKKSVSGSAKGTLGTLPKLGEPKSRTASAQSAISNISTASKGIAYEFKLNDGGNSIVKSHPPRALKRLEVTPEMKLTFDQLNSQLNKAEERKSKLIAEKQERIKTMSSGRAPLRPKTAAPNQEFEEKLEKKLADAEERKKKLAEDNQKKQQDKDARARRVREKANVLQNPQFVNKMDTYGQDGNLEAPLSPMPPVKNHVDSFVVESEPSKKDDDGFFG